LKAAWIEEVVLALTATVLTLKVVLVCPAGMVTVAGTVAAAVLLLVRVTMSPPVAATPLNVTVAVVPVPPITEFAVSANEDTVGACTVTAPEASVELIDPVICTTTLLLTGEVVTLKLAVVDPAETVTVAGTCAAAVVVLVSVTTAPPVGAGWVNVTTPVVPWPPRTLVGVWITTEEISTGGVTAKGARAFELLKLAVMLPVAVVVTEDVVIVNWALVCPAETTTVAGTVAETLVLESVTVSPVVAAAAPLRVTVPVIGFPPTTLAWLSTTDTNVGACTVKGACCVLPFTVP
jgi:hypothetical protein